MRTTSLIIGTLALMLVIFPLNDAKAILIPKSNTTSPSFRSYTNTPHFDLDSYKLQRSIDRESYQLQRSIDGVSRQLNNLNDQLRRERGYDSFQRLRDARSQSLAQMKAMGLDAFNADNEGHILIGEEIVECPSNSHVVSTFCVCDEGYIHSLIGKIKLDSPTPCISKSYFTPQPQKSQSTCPENSQISDDEEWCICNLGFTGNTGAEGSFSCVRTNEPPGSECPDHPIPDEYPKMQQKCRGISPSFDEWNCVPTPEPNDLCDCKEGYVANDGYCEKEGQASVETRLPRDVPSNSWYGEALHSLLAEEALEDDEEFRPQDKATRGEFVHLLVTMNQGSQIATAEVNGFSIFDDVPEHYQSTFNVAAYSGWVKGEGNCVWTQRPCLAKPNDPINRAEAVSLIVRALKLNSNKMKEWEEMSAPLFRDVPHDAWFTETIQIAADNCILQGNSAGWVYPSDNLNRAEMAVMIHRASQNLTYPNCE